MEDLIINLPESVPNLGDRTDILIFLENYLTDKSKKYKVEIENNVRTNREYENFLLDELKNIKSITILKNNKKAFHFDIFINFDKLQLCRELTSIVYDRKQ